MKRVTALLLALILVYSCAPGIFAASEEAIAAANHLHELGLFNGVGTNPDGSINYDLDRTMTRAEAVTMLVRLLGKEEEAKASVLVTPFTDVAEWAKPYVGYAYAHGLTTGTGTTTFGGSDNTTTAQYLTFILRALGYESGTDFQWDKAWEKTDALGITKGEYNAGSNFERADAVIVSDRTLSVKLKNTDKVLLDTIVPKQNEQPSGQNSTVPEQNNTPRPSVTLDDLQGIWHCDAGNDGSFQELTISGDSIIIAWYSNYSPYESYKYEKGTITGIKIDEVSSIVSILYTSLSKESFSPFTLSQSENPYQYSSEKTNETYEIKNFDGNKFLANHGYNLWFKKVSRSSGTSDVRKKLDYLKNGLDTSKITAKLVIPHVGASNNSMATLVIKNYTGHTIILDSAVYVNGYLCFANGSASKEVELLNHYTYQIPVYYGLIIGDRSTVKDDMYLDNNSKARFTILYNGARYQGECDVNGNTSIKKA